MEDVIVKEPENIEPEETPKKTKKTKTKKTKTFIYKVKKGDTLSKIAKEHRTTIKKIAKDNDILDVNLIHRGQRLKIKK